MLGKTPRILKSGVHTRTFYEDLWRAITSGDTWRGELCNKKRNGEIYWESASISPVRGDSGEVTHFVSVKLDITDRKRAEQQLEQAKEAAEAANRAKSVFLASMSHEIRTPMNAILGFSQLLAGDPDLTPRQREQLDAISRSGEHLLALINDVLEMSKIEAGRATLTVEEVDIHSLLRDLDVMFRLRTEEKGLKFGIESAGEVPRYASVDEGKLRQILVNLVGNAVKFTASGGILVRVRASAEPGGLLLLVDVEDTGPGLSEADLHRLFHLFEQARAGREAGSGTGLGLAISRGFARLMGGDLTVRSRPGEGSVVSLSVPVVPCEGAAARRGVDSRRVGFDLRTASDGREGAGALRAALLESVPVPLRRGLAGALRKADLDEVRELTDEMEAIHPEAARFVRDLAERFEYELLLDSLGDDGGK